MKTVADKIHESKSSELKKYVSFMISGTCYAVEVLRIKEVLYHTQITEVPDTIPSMRGVIDLRGTIVPVIDLRMKFKYSEREYDRDTVIIISEFNNSLVGLIVDAVSDVIDMRLEDISDVPDFSFHDDINGKHILGVGRIDKDLAIVLNIDSILSPEEITKISNINDNNV